MAQSSLTGLEREVVRVRGQARAELERMQAVTATRSFVISVMRSGIICRRSGICCMNCSIRRPRA